VVVDKFTDEKGVEKDVTRELRFLDSFRFMPSSLDKLAKNLQRDKFINLKKYFADKKFDLVHRKGVFPYDYVDSLEKLKEEKLPPKEAFYSRFSDENISDEDYSHAQTVWKEFGMSTFRDYLELYNKSDVLILADIFENFRNVCTSNYDLDPAWYYMSPGLAWDAMLKATKVTLQLLIEPDMLLLVEKGIRGGISTISHRYGEANNPYMEINVTKQNRVNI